MSVCALSRQQQPNLFPHVPIRSCWSLRIADKQRKAKAEASSRGLIQQVLSPEEPLCLLFLFFFPKGIEGSHHALQSSHPVHTADCTDLLQNLKPVLDRRVRTAATNHPTAASSPAWTNMKNRSIVKKRRKKTKKKCILENFCVRHGSLEV